MIKLLQPELASYNGSLHTIYFVNGSLIHFGHWSGEASELEYNGQEYDWIFLDEATQFTWRAFQFLGGLLRGVNDIPKRMYITCNPGGVGHRWVKRLFIDREFIQNRENPEENENPDDYVFIPATVEDNTALLKSSPGYLRMLSSMPENLRRAYRYGDWDSLGGNYFPELDEAVHVSATFSIPKHWKRYRAFDYGLDMFACAWFAVDEQGRSWMYREYSKSGLIVQEAARAMLERTLPGETDRGNLRAAGHVVAAEGLRTNNGGAVRRVRGAYSQGGQQPGAGPHADKGDAGQAGRRPSGPDVFRDVQADDRRSPGHTGRRAKPERLRQGAARGHAPGGRGEVLLHLPRGERLGGGGAGGRSGRRARLRRIRPWRGADARVSELLTVQEAALGGGISRRR